jgi:hypothetical protein
MLGDSEVRAGAMATTGDGECERWRAAKFGEGGRWLAQALASVTELGE